MDTLTENLHRIDEDWTFSEPADQSISSWVQSQKKSGVVLPIIKKLEKPLQTKNKKPAATPFRVKQIYNIHRTAISPNPIKIRTYEYHQSNLIQFLFRNKHQVSYK